MKNKVKEAIECILCAIFAYLAFWFFCYCTPNQLSGESDWYEEWLKENAITLHQPHYFYD